VIGDVGGHLEELRSELDRLGADPVRARLPDELTVIQVGDLVHRGPESDGVVALVDRFLTNQPGQWIQLVGNHEAQYLREPSFDWPESISAQAAETIRQWWSIGQMRAAAAIVTENESFLVTHAGLTVDFWRKTLGEPGSAPDAAAAINALIGTREDVLFRAGHMLGGRRATGAAGPVWASTATELVPGWLRRELPFSQVHGHATLFDWDEGRFRAGEEMSLLTVVDTAAKHETTTLSGGRIVGVDPGHGRNPQPTWRAWEIVG
jgi:hypothetical protein